jgi:hypothetical protein
MKMGKKNVKNLVLKDKKKLKYLEMEIYKKNIMEIEKKWEL